MADCSRKIAFVCNVDYFFLSHRLPLAEEAIKKGFKVYLLTRNTGHKNKFTDKGIYFIDIPFERSGKNPFHEAFCVYKLIQVYRKYNFDVIHHITLKASLLGSIAAKLTSKKQVVNAISGFGYNFTDGRNGILQKVIKALIKFSFKSKYFHFILQNQDDVEEVKGMMLVPNNHLHLIEGSGIDLNTYKYFEVPNNNVKVFLFPARLLFDKGLVELLKAATSLQKQYFNKMKIILAGDIDVDNLASISECDLNSYLVADYIEWVGYQKDMYSLYCKSDVVVLPSYREGLPKSLIEACAVGRPIITTDAPGCKSCIWNNNENGLLINAKDIDALRNAIVDMCESSDDELIEMGQSSRRLAVKKFSIEEVKAKTFAIYTLF